MESVDLENPYLLGDTRRLMAVLPVSRLEAWRLIGTALKCPDFRPKVSWKDGLLD